MRTMRIPFAVDGRGFFAWTDKPEQIVEQQILDWLLTNWGDRVGNPGYGANLRILLFTNIDIPRLTQQRDTIKQGLDFQLTLADVISVDFREESPGVLRITVMYRLIPQQDVRTFVYLLNGLVTEETAL